MATRVVLSGLAAACLALAADQWSKSLILAHFAASGTQFETINPFLNFVPTRNRGISFSLFSSGGQYTSVILVSFALVITLALLYQLWRSRTFGNALGWGFIIGGALGNNLMDRLRLGSVIDFIDVHVGQFHPFIFNLADAAISLGVVLLLIDGLLTRTESPK